MTLSGSRATKREPKNVDLAIGWMKMAGRGLVSFARMRQFRWRWSVIVVRSHGGESTTEMCDVTTPTTNERTESGLLENGSLTLLSTGLVLATPLGELEGKAGTRS
ncbi:hypothetical protein Salat_0011200 [Sesamum alatum]|uniref:Uncharacterized protein n=1 Tax=Sesamum alatum TaxID=300844 RepID=A0AAE2CW92_9LAMI|nr:hypothetical protein Salat_0011200 [Sesamum alatum]